MSGVRLRDLSPVGVLVGLVALATLGYAGYAAVGILTGLWAGNTGQIAGGLFAFAMLAGMTYVDATPEYDGTCDECGTRFAVNSGAERADSYVTVRATGAPKRITIGPISFVAAPVRTERNYCTAECAEQDTITVPAAINGELLSEDHYRAPAEVND